MKAAGSNGLVQVAQRAVLHGQQRHKAISHAAARGHAAASALVVAAAADGISTSMQQLAWLGVRIFVTFHQTACLLLPLLLAHQLPPLPLPLVHYLRLHGRQHVPVCRHGKEHDSFACSSKLEGPVVLCLHT